MVQVSLPHVARMDVTVNPATKVILVTARPDFSYFSKFRGKIPDGMNPEVRVVWCVWRAWGGGVETRWKMCAWEDQWFCLSSIVVA